MPPALVGIGKKTGNLNFCKYVVKGTQRRFNPHAAGSVFQQEKLLGRSRMISCFWWWVAGTQAAAGTRHPWVQWWFGVPHLSGTGLLALD